MSCHFDVVIVGAGPSGCTCALALRHSGLKIALIDKDSFPRTKPCGDSIPGPAFRAIDSINPDLGNELRSFSKGVEIRKTALIGMNGQKIIKNWNQFAYNCKRYDFDNYLLNMVRKQSNVVLIENKKLTKVENVNDEIQCYFKDQKSFKSKLIIGCDGANSIVKRELLPKSDHNRNNNKAFAVSSYFAGVKGVVFDQNEMLYIKKYPNGYFWIFPVGNEVVNVGFGVLPNNIRQKEVRILDAFKGIIATDPIVSPRFEYAKMLDQIKGAPLPFGGKRRKISGNRFMLCGDAASLVNPLSGAGIDNAIWSGIYAADQTNKCFTASSFDSKFMLNYKHAVYRKLGFKLRKDEVIMRMAIRYPWIVATVFKFSKNNLNKSAVI